MQKGDKLKIFPDTDINAYINYFHSEGLRTRVSGDYILITGYCSRRKVKKDFRKLESVGKRIKHIRRSMYFSIEELAKEIGTTPLTIESWEDGRIIPMGPTFERFLEFSGATREYVIDGQGKWVDEIKEIMRELERGESE